MRIIVFFSCFLGLLLTKLTFCEELGSLRVPSNQNVQPREFSDQKGQCAAPQLVTYEELVNRYHWNLPASQDVGDMLPPQLGDSVVIDDEQYVVTKNGKSLNWTAFTLVLFLSDSGKIEVLTQVRAIPPVDVIETMGGHLKEGQSWREGVRAELFEEAGITIGDHELSELIFLEGGELKYSRSRKRIYGNVNFCVVFKGMKPHTLGSAETDLQRGHVWYDLHDLFEEVCKDEQTSLSPRHHGIYYSFFRSHVKAFYQQVFGCKAV